MRPFAKGDTSSVFRYHIEQIKERINKLDNDYILNASRVEQEEYWIAEGLINELVVDWDKIEIDNKRDSEVIAYDHFDRSQFKVPGTRFELCIPYRGDKSLFELRASTFSLSGYPEIELQMNLLIIPVKYQDSSADASKIKSMIDGYVKQMTSAVNYINADVRNHNNSVEKQIKTAIAQKIDRAQKSLVAFDLIGIPMKRKATPDAFATDVQRKVVTRPQAQPRKSKQEYKPEPFLEEKEYSHILEVLRSMSKVIERNPEAFKDLNEEGIRTHFLLQLNGHYDGKATGETFNKIGKTDILIRDGDRNVFIGECKFWKGQKSFNAAIDQLLGYLAWRDSKCALLIFNKNKNSTDVAEKMHEVMSNRSECRKVIKHDVHGDSRYVFVKESDPGREIVITTQLYDMPDS